MPFVARLNYPKLEVPSRVYVHTTGIGVYGDHIESLLEGARHEFESDYQAQSHPSNTALTSDISHFDYILAVMWGDVRDNKPVIDYFGLTDVSGTDWRGNPGFSSWVRKDDDYVGGDFHQEATCGDGMMVLGREEEYRRTASSRDVFINEPPILPMFRFEKTGDEYVEIAKESVAVKE